MPRTDAEREELQIEANLLAALKRKKTSRTGHLTPTKQVEPPFLMKQQIAHSRRVAIKRLAKSKRAFDEMQQNNTNPSKKMRTPSRTPPSRPPCPTSRLRFVCDGPDLLDDEPTCWGWCFYCRCLRDFFFNNSFCSRCKTRGQFLLSIQNTRVCSLSWCCCFLLS